MAWSRSRGKDVVSERDWCMTPLFRHPFPEQETDEAMISNEENAQTTDAIVPEGLISASELPSASQTLDDLFREDASEPSGVEAERPTIRELLLDEEVAAEAANVVPESENASAPSVNLEQPDLDPVEAETVTKAATMAAQAEATNDANVQPDKLVPDSSEGIVTTTEAALEAAVTHNPTTPDRTAPPEQFDATAEAPVAEASTKPVTESQSDTDSESEPIAANTLKDPEEASPAAETKCETLAEPSLEALGEDARESSTPAEVEAGDPVSPAVSEAEPTAVAVQTTPVSSSDWALEERLACHKEWVDSRGRSGNKTSLAGAELEDAELIEVNLRHADLQDSNLKGADLLLADLRDACMVRTNLQEACLVGANLEGANLEGAALDTAMGLVPRQLAGANLHEASLPEQISQFEAKTEFSRVSQLVARFFTAMMAISAVSSLMIWKTKDLQLLSDSSILPFLHSPAAAAALPTAQIYLIAPVVLFIVYLVFHFHLQNLWDAVLQLPSLFPDGRELGQDGPRVVTGLLRAHFRWMNRDAASTRVIERALAFVLAYWVAPLVLLLFWARYLTLQDLHGTMLHTLLAVVASGVALYSTTKVGRPPERWSVEAERRWDWVSKLREVNPLNVSGVLGAMLLLLAIGTVKGAPHDKARAPQFGESNIRRWAPTVFWSLGFDPYADLTEASISTKPADWSGADDQISAVKGVRLGGISFRYAQAYGVFLVNAHLWRSNFQGAFLSGADLRGSDLGQSTLRYSIMDGARLYRANLDRSNLDGANLDRADFREANLSHCSLVGSILIDAQLQNATLYGARLSGSSMERANLEKTDLRSAYLDNVNLEHANLQQTYLWSAKLPGADLRNAHLTSTIFIDADAQNADFRGAQLNGTVLNGTNLSGANIDGVDLRAALGLTVAQICSTKSRNGAILTDPLAAQVRDACGGPLLVAPASTAVVPATTGAAGSQEGKSSVPFGKNGPGTAPAAKNGAAPAQPAPSTKKTQQ